MFERETKQAAPEALSDEQLEFVSGGEKTCVQSCEPVKGTTVIVCGPIICF